MIHEAIARPTRVEACQFDGSDASAAEIARFVGRLHATGPVGDLAIWGPDRIVPIPRGSWLLRTDAGQFLVLSDEEFLERFAVVRDPAVAMGTRWP
jgi:hypothetical protein